MWTAIQKMTVGWKQQFLQIVEIVSILTFIGGVVINVAFYLEKNQFDSFPFVTIASLLIFVIAHRLSGRSFLSTTSVSGSSSYTGPMLGAFLLSGASLKLWNLSGFFYGAVLFLGFLALFSLIKYAAKKLTNRISKTETN
jgi:hypothetical protein